MKLDCTYTPKISSFLWLIQMIVCKQMKRFFLFTLCLFYFFRKLCGASSAFSSAANLLYVIGHLLAWPFKIINMWKKDHPVRDFFFLNNLRVSRIAEYWSQCNNVVCFLKHVLKVSGFGSVFYCVIWLETFCSVLVSDNLHIYQLWQN